MKDLKIIAGANIAILIIYTILSKLLNSETHENLGLLITLAFFIAIHVVITLSISIFHFSQGNKNLGKSYLLSSAIVLLIGFSSCFGAASM